MSITQPTQQECLVAVFEEEGQPLNLKRVSIPELQTGEILVKIDACTVCGSDIHTIRGLRKEKTPTILGHEIVGTIVRLGSSAMTDINGNELAVGNRLTWSVCLSCGSCDRCQTRIPQKCRDIRKIGHETLTETSGLIGGFAEYILLPATASVLKLRSDVSLEVICPANCATATTMAAFRKLENERLGSILILGAGLLGLTACAYAKTLGYRQITVIDPNTLRQDISGEFGATHSSGALGKLDPNSGFDAIMDFAGDSKSIEDSVLFANIGADVVLVGSVMPGQACNFNPEHLVRNLISIHGVHNYAPCDLESALTFLARYGDEFPFAKLVEKTFQLSKINEALDYAIAAKPVRIMIQP